MWIIRFLSGPLAGQLVPLEKHQTLLGRSPSCDIKIPSSSVSKEHTRIEIFDDKVIVTDVGSRNGTFVNGVQVRSSKAKSGDKVALHDIFFELQSVPDTWAQQYKQQQAFGGGYGRPPMPPQQYGNAAQQHYPQMNPGPSGQPYAGAQAHDLGQPQMQEMNNASGEENPINDLFQGKVPHWATLLQEYIDRVVLPGLYRMPEMFEFKWVLAGIMAAFILLVTSLSTIPLIRILKVSIEEESQQHALTIATTLARVNRPAISQGLDTAVTVDIAASRPGVKKAFIISNVDGNVLAPAAQAGTYPDLGYINEGRRLTKESVKQIDDSSVVAMVPIEFFNAETGAHAVTAWAVVLYDMSSLAVDNSQVLSLFITTLFISLLLGTLLFYLLYKLIEHPLASMNKQLDQALKEGQETVQTPYMFPALQLLASNVSSALTRAGQSTQQSNSGRVMEHDRNREAGNLVNLMGFAAMAIRSDDLGISAVNTAFEQRLGQPAATLTTISVNELSDQALKLSTKDLIERLDQNPDEIASNELEFSGHQYQVVAQAIFGSSKIAYYLIILLPAEGGG